MTEGINGDDLFSPKLSLGRPLTNTEKKLITISLRSRDLSNKDPEDVVLQAIMALPPSLKVEFEARYPVDGVGDDALIQKNIQKREEIARVYDKLMYKYSGRIKSGDVSAVLNFNDDFSTQLKEPLDQIWENNQMRHHNAESSIPLTEKALTNLERALLSEMIRHLSPNVPSWDNLVRQLPDSLKLEFLARYPITDVDQATLEASTKRRAEIEHVYAQMREAISRLDTISRILAFNRAFAEQVGEDITGGNLSPVTELSNLTEEELWSMVEERIQDHPLAKAIEQLENWDES